MSAVLFFAYGLIAYAAFLVTILYAIGFVGNFVVPKSIDSGTSATVGEAVLVNVAILGLFAVQHTIMARPRFKAWWAKVVPSPIERSTFVLVASLILLLLFWQWRPLPGVVWAVNHSVAGAVLTGLSFLGWGLVFYSSFLIDHFDLFGLRQVYFHLARKEYVPARFQMPLLYRLVRNPLMLGFIIAFWFTPVMTQGHLLFAAVSTAYIFVGVRFEEHDIANALGEPYRVYRARTSMILPLPPKPLPQAGASAEPSARPPAQTT